MTRGGRKDGGDERLEQRAQSPLKGQHDSPQRTLTLSVTATAGEQGAAISRMLPSPTEILSDGFDRCTAVGQWRSGRVVEPMPNRSSFCCNTSEGRGRSEVQDYLDIVCRGELAALWSVRRTRSHTW